MPNKENVKSHEFKKGESGNPKGRPKGSKNRSTIAKKWLEASQKKMNILTGELEKLSFEDLMTLAQIQKAIEDKDVQSYKALMDSAFGGVIQQNDMNLNIEKGNLPEWLNDSES
tara:strand:- start:1428 stop:1769 length:342 start_codon:yes stop_codon:yes gene_type:complete